MTRLDQLKLEYKIKHRLLDIELAVYLQTLTEEEKNMAVSADTQQLIQSFDTATSAIADRIQRLVAQTGLSADDKAAFQTEIDKLNALGKDSNKPVPSTA